MGVFSKNQGGKKSLKRNTYPVSRQINTTFNFGQLIPFSVREINPGESVKIRPSVGLRFMPTYFPVQNKMKCYINYFYVRSRNLYKDFKQFYEDNSPATSHPYLGFPSYLKSSRSKMFSVGGLADHMGVSVTRHVSKGEVLRVSFNVNDLPVFNSYSFRFSNVGNSPVVPVGETPVNSLLYTDRFLTSVAYRTDPQGVDVSSGRVACFRALIPTSSDSFISGSYQILSSQLDSSVVSFLNSPDFSVFAVAGYNRYSDSAFLPLRFSPAVSLVGASAENPISIPVDIPDFVFEDAPGSIPDKPSDYQPAVLICFTRASSDAPVIHLPDNAHSYLSPLNGSSSYRFSYAEPSVVSVSRTLDILNPFSEELDAESFVPLNSMPFRAYEQIYNAFYRDERNNPLMKDGKPVYDEFLLNTNGGRDDFDYQIHYRNWEQDAYTTALPSPQQGIAPLVGISSTGIATFQDLESGKQYTVKSITDDTGDKVVNAEFTEDSLNDMNEDWKPSVARALVSYATSGISINDFRNVNALQRFKELNLRRGRKYKDLMEARFGVNISYAEMNMPEFIGGASFDVQPVQVNQTTNQGENDPLGSYAGQLFASGGSKHSITKFCDEHGYIIGIISVVPTPVYETVTPKFFFKHHLLDFWQPEFNHIGLQPIPMKELDVFGQFVKSPDNMDEEFGYQRPWYDYISALDSVHGQFRTSLSSFVMYRSWSEPPSLSPDFLLVDPSSGIDDVFSVRTDAEGNSVDKILGQIYEDYTIKSPVSKFGIAKLE